MQSNYFIGEDHEEDPVQQYLLLYFVIDQES